MCFHYRYATGIVLLRLNHPVRCTATSQVSSVYLLQRKTQTPHSDSFLALEQPMPLLPIGAAAICHHSMLHLSPNAQPSVLLNCRHYCASNCRKLAHVCCTATRRRTVAVMIPPCAMLLFCRGSVHGRLVTLEGNTSEINKPLPATINVEGIDHAIQAGLLGDYYRSALPLPKSPLCNPLFQFCRRLACLTTAIAVVPACTDCQPLPRREGVMTHVAGLSCCDKVQSCNYSCRS